MPVELDLEEDVARPRDEERLNSITHWAGFLGAVTATLCFVDDAAKLELFQRASFHAYSWTLMGMYAISALSHSVHTPAKKHLLRALDQGEIYLLIAGTYTPLIASQTPVSVRSELMASLWIVAIGLCSRKVVLQRDVIQFSARSYLLLGWIPAMVLLPYLPNGCLAGLLIGGLFYTAGAWFLLNDRRHRFYHAIWHLMVIVASVCHYFVIWHYVLRPALIAA